MVDDKVLGVISIGDVVRGIIEDDKFHLSDRDSRWHYHPWRHRVSWREGF